MFWKNVIKQTIGKIVFVKRNIAEKENKLFHPIPILVPKMI